MSLLQSLRAAGSFDSEGAFTLDVAKARDKMARFQLTDPERYILELVAAAFATGAPDLAVKEIGDTLELRFGGNPLSELETLEDYLLVTEGVTPALRYLAVGLNALTRLKPKLVRLETPAGKALELRGGKKSVRAGKFTAHRLVIERAHGLLVKPSYAKELALLADEASDGGRPVRINGVAKLGPAPLELVAGRELSEVSLVLHGVTRSRVRAPGLACRAVIENDDFVLNASHAGIVEDATYHQAMETLEGQALQQLHELCVQASQDRGVLDRHRLYFLSLGGLKADGPWRSALENLPIFQGPHTERHSFAALEAQRKRLGFIPTTALRMSFEPEGLLIVHLDAGAEASFLEARRLPTQDASPSLLGQMTTRNNRTRWEQSPRPRALPEGDYLVRDQGEVEGTFLAVGLPARVTAGSLLHILYQGKHLSSATLENGLCYVAVLDFPQLEIAEDWSGPDSDGKLYRAARKEVAARAQALYEELARGQDPRAYDQLLLSLVAQGEKSPSAGLDLIPTLQGGRVSLRALKEAKSVGTVPALLPPLPSELPPGALPEGPIVRATEALTPLLRQQLGKKLVDARTQVERLLDLAQRLSHPREPRLDTPGFAFEGPVRGELKLRKMLAPGNSRLTVLREGVELEQRSLQPIAWPYDAIVDSPRLNPTPDWQRVQADRAWQEVVDRLRLAEQEAFVELALSVTATPSQLPGWEEALLKALDKFPELSSRVASLPLFPSNGGYGRISLAELETELAQQGRLAFTLGGSSVLGVLHKPDQELLAKLLPGVSFEVHQVPRVQEKRSFEKPRAQAEPAVLQGRYLLKRQLAFGEVGLTDALTGGTLRITGRPAIPNALPRAADAAITADGLKFGSDQKPKRDKAFESRLRELREVIGAMAIECSRDVVAGSSVGWMLLRLLTSVLPDQARKTLEVLPLVPMHAAPPLSVKELRPQLDRLPAVPIIEAGFPFAPLARRPVICATPEQARILSNLFEKPCRSDKDELLRDEDRRKNRRKSAGLKVRLPDCLAEIEIEQGVFRGRVGLARNPNQSVLICLEDDQPVGELRDTGLAGYVRGKFAFSDLHDRVIVDREQVRALRELQVELIEQLATDYEASPSEAARKRLLQFLTDNRREMGSRSPVGQVVDRVLELALFPAAEGRRATPRNLLEEAGKGSLAYLQRPGPRDEEGQLLPVLPPKSSEWEAARALVGEKRLQLEERPTLVERGWSWVGWGWRRAWAGLDRQITRMVESSARSESARAVEEAPVETPEELLTRALRREFNLLGMRGAWIPLIEGLTANTWVDADVFGGAVVFKKGLPVLNWTHSAVRYTRDHHQEDPGCLTLLTAHLFCELNRARWDITNEHEMAFLTKLARKLRSSYDANPEAER